MLFHDLPNGRIDVPRQKKLGRHGIDCSTEDVLDVVHFIVHLPSYKLKRAGFDPSKKLCFATVIFIEAIEQLSELSVWSVLRTSIDSIMMYCKVFLRGIEDLEEGTVEQQLAELQYMNLFLNALVLRYWSLG